MARALSRAANFTVAEALGAAKEAARPCRRLGVTGPPGVGKSSLIAALAPHRLPPEGDIAILAIDPTSPVSGGAILGDRIRMEALAQNPRIFIRSLGSRSHHDGLADNLPDLLAIVESAGFVESILETVGVGQVEYAVRNVADTILLVLMPGAGDQIQAMKSGILEMADILVVNKSDQPGARQLVSELAAIIDTRASRGGGWTPPILLTSIKDPSTVAGLSIEIDRHQAWLDQGTASAAHRLERRRARHVGSLIARRVGEIIAQLPPEALAAPLASLYAAVAREIAATAKAALPQQTRE